MSSSLPQCQPDFVHSANAMAYGSIDADVEHVSDEMIDETTSRKQSLVESAISPVLQNYQHETKGTRSWSFDRDGATGPTRMKKVHSLEGITALTSKPLEVSVTSADQQSYLIPLSRPVSRHPSIIGTDASKLTDSGSQDRKRQVITKAAAAKSAAKGGFTYYIIYAIVNVIISVPGLYGYAAVIFNNPAFQPHMNALSKLVIFSSLIHQLGFCLFSSLPFAIGTVQDAGLIFLSAMSNIIANTILGDGGTMQEVVSTSLVILSLGTALLGLVLVAMGKFRLANAVSYLPMPVVGGYLAFIGYFCLEAGVALCISEAMITVADWAYLFDPQNLLLAFPGLLAGLILTLISRKVENDAALPLAMIIIPAIFYVIIYATGVGIEGAREGGWVGEVAPPVPFSDLFKLVDFNCVKWRLATKCLATWTGMVFVVSFASCLDVAAISMDMGEALDTNKELATVGICNFMSGLTFGFTGSYIFSQTIFTYRTGVHSRWIGIFIMVTFMAVVVSTINFLQVAPLFFLGSTLIFIGWDLLYEWLVEIRHKIFLTEYLVLLATFVAIQVIGIDAGIIFGVIVAVVDHVCTTARASSLKKVSKRSRAVWKPDDWKLLQEHGYQSGNPKIVALEITGSVFFGSSMQLLSNISEEVGLDASTDTSQNELELSIASPHRSSYLLTKGERTTSILKAGSISKKGSVIQSRPNFVVLDLAQVPNLDASSARGCFLQLSKMCAKRGIVVCAAGACPRAEWMLRSHEVAYSLEEEERIKDRLQDVDDDFNVAECTKTILFLTIYEALEFCENMLIHQLSASKNICKSSSFIRLDDLMEPSGPKNSLADVLSHIVGLSGEERKLLESVDIHDENKYQNGDIIFQKSQQSDAFFVVLGGAVAVTRGNLSKKSATAIVSGAGKVEVKGSRTNPAFMERGVVKAILQVGNLIGFVDYILERPRGFNAIAWRDGTIVARIPRSRLARVTNDNPEVGHIIQSVLLQASILELGNCTCSE